MNFFGVSQSGDGCTAENHLLCEWTPRHGFKTALGSWVNAPGPAFDLLSALLSLCLHLVMFTAALLLLLLLLQIRMIQARV